jgi:hypothetical protein
MIKIFLFLFILKMVFQYNNKENYHLNNLNDLDRFYGFYNLNNYTSRSKFNVGNDERLLNNETINSINSVNNEYDYELLKIIKYNRKKKLLDRLIGNELSNLQKYELIMDNDILSMINKKKINISEAGLFDNYNFDFDE